jgi:SAM-dependent methyltransferase
MSPYEFCADWAARHARDGQVLDYGCGAGQIVGLLRARGVKAFGCDVFYEGGDYSDDIPADLKPFIQRMNPRIPFEDGQFNVVLSNFVFEHVPDIRFALSEIKRVLKPGGLALSVFPDRGVWREGHCGLPFLHWFPQGRTRVYYAAALNALGLGLHREGRSSMDWAQNFCTWLDDWTHYRDSRELDARFSELGPTSHIEPEWFAARLPRFAFLPTALQRLIVRKLACVALVSVKH